MSSCSNSWTYSWTFPEDWPTPMVSGQTSSVIDRQADGSFFVGLSYEGWTGYGTAFFDIPPTLTPQFRSGVNVTGSDLTPNADGTLVEGELTTLQIIGHQADGKTPIWSSPTFHSFETTSGAPFTLEDVVPDSWATPEYISRGMWDDGLSWGQPYGPSPYTDGLADDWYFSLDSFAITGTDKDDYLVAVYDGRVTEIDGAKGDDQIVLNDAGGFLRGGPGDDDLRGFSTYESGGLCNADHATHTEELSILFGEVGADTIIYYSGLNRIRGGVGDDDIYFSGLTSDTVKVYARIRAGQGDDVVELGGTHTIAYGGGGDDRLVMKADLSVATGGDGADTFEFDLSQSGLLRIQDFDLTEDMLDANGGLTVEEFTAAAHTNSNGHTVVDLDDLKVVLLNVDLGDLLESDFLL